ncbi:hypothetical protein TNCV_1901061 [Trichonephila clavipes]|nr:hypothetical protein TNCV_1901061 [Trichonephila clavipes]
MYGRTDILITKSLDVASKHYSLSVLRESAGIYSDIWVRRTLNPVSGKRRFNGMADRKVLMFGSRSLLLYKRRQASRRSFEAWILTSRSLRCFGVLSPSEL